MVWLIIVLIQVLFFVELYIAFTLVPVGDFNNNIDLIWFMINWKYIGTQTDSGIMFCKLSATVSAVVN